MPPKKSGGPSKATKPKEPAEPPKKRDQQTLHEITTRAWTASHPFAAQIREGGVRSLAAADQAVHSAHRTARDPKRLEPLSKKATKELWKTVSEAGHPVAKPWDRDEFAGPPPPGCWAKDKAGRSTADLPLAKHREWLDSCAELFLLDAESREFRRKRALKYREWRDSVEERSLRVVDVVAGLDTDTATEAETGAEAVAEEDNEGETKPDGGGNFTPFLYETSAVAEEKERRNKIAAFQDALHGTKMGMLAQDPEWDDVVPIPQDEPEGALASIAYPDDYAEAMSYLRAVMAAEEYSTRCLNLTSQIISMNPAHYTVWLYRFDILKHLSLPLKDELAWLSEIALDFQKNYQIWHHRQLLLDELYPTVSQDDALVRSLAISERRFLETMFAEDAKNYHVWSYRQYLVRKLAMWPSQDPEELPSIANMVDDDVRNNSAWSHRFFLVFSDPEYASPDSAATAHDPNVPADIVDREIDYAKAQIARAPQNQSPWNYLRGVLVKGGRPLAEVREFAESHVEDLGGEAETVRSSHALDLLADVYAEVGERERAELCLKRLAEKWDRIRAGYWTWRAGLLGQN